MNRFRLIQLLVMGFLAALLLASCSSAAPQAGEEPGSAVVQTVEIGKEAQQATGEVPSSGAPLQPPLEIGPTSQAPEEPAAPAIEAPKSTIPGNPPEITPAYSQSMPTEVPSEILPEIPPATQLLPSPTFIPESTSAVPPPAPPSDHLVQVEWPSAMRLGESDVVTLQLVATSQGYLLVADYPEHDVLTQTITIEPVSGYEVFASARLDAVGFEISPSGDKVQYFSSEEKISWRWSLIPRQPGRQRLTVNLSLRWVPVENAALPVREVTVYTQALDVRVISYLGLSQTQAMFTGFLTLLLGGGLSASALVLRPRASRRSQRDARQPPNPDLKIELPAELRLSLAERSLLKVLFARYARLVIEHEFLSGYSGARTFLGVPVRLDGRSDAYTIAKIGDQPSILREYQNYEQFVKDTLPPVTARIQHPPVLASNGAKRKLAALQYTFIGEAGHPPTSLRQTLLENPDPSLILLLMETFGPNWWMQHRPYTFRCGLEYDRVLPTHLVIEPYSGKGTDLDGRTHPTGLDFQPGDLVTLRNFASAELRQDQVSLSLLGHPASGHPPLRVRWLAAGRTDGMTGRVVATRRTLLRGFVDGCDLFGLPDPIESIDRLLSMIVHGSQSILHGDLNLENILLGPGKMLWLIDFAQTREGHTLFDFAHLGAEIIAHLAAARLQEPSQLLPILHGDPQAPDLELSSLFAALREAAGRLSINPHDEREFQLAFGCTCLGALKYVNLDKRGKQLLYLASADLLNSLQI
jgi:hypothetical protein